MREVMQMGDEKKDEPDGNWLTNPAYWDLCDEHETTFPMGDHCPKCGPPPKASAADNGTGNQEREGL